MILPSWRSPNTHLCLLSTNDVDVEYSKGVVTVRLLVISSERSQVRECIFQIQGQRKLQIVPERSQLGSDRHLSGHFVHGPGAQVELHQDGEDAKHPAKDHGEIEAPPHLTRTNASRSLIVSVARNYILLIWFDLICCVACPLFYALVDMFAARSGIIKVNCRLLCRACGVCTKYSQLEMHF